MKEIFKAPGPNPLENMANGEEKLAGFWQGLWHGITAPVTLVMSLFKEDTGIYEVHNNGGWYNFGFIFGMMISFGNGSVKKKPAYDS